MHIWKYEMEQKNVRAVRNERKEELYWTEDDFKLENEIWILEDIINTYAERTRTMVSLFSIQK